MSDELAVLVELLSRGYVPRIAVFYDGANEKGRGVRGKFWDNVSQDYVHADYLYHEVLDALDRTERMEIRNLALVKFATRVHDFILRHVQTPHPADLNTFRASSQAHARGAAANYAANAEVAAALGRAYGFEVVLVLQPLGTCLPQRDVNDFPVSGPPPEYWRIYYGDLYPALRSAAATRGLKVVDLCSALRDRVARGEGAFNTSIHLNSAGNEFMAHKLATLITVGGPRDMNKASR